MQKYELLLATLKEVELSGIGANQLLSEEVKHEFKNLIDDAGNIALVIEKVKSINFIDNSEDYNTKLLDDAVSSVFRLYKLSSDILEKLCQFSGLTQPQINELKKACKAKENLLDKGVKLLLEADALGHSLIHYPEIQSIIFPKKKATKKYENKTGFDAFVSYIITSGAPSYVLEQIARLTIYQNLFMKDDLEKNLKFRNIYEKFTETSNITSDEIEYAKKIIYKRLLDNIKEFPIYIKPNTIPEATYSKSEYIKRDFLKNLSPANYLDAWGEKSGKLLAYCVTNEENFQKQDLQIVRIANAIENGLLKGTIPGIDNYEIIGLCKPALTENSSNNIKFHNLLIQMKENGKINKGEFNSLKISPVHEEILNILRNTSPILYEKITGKVKLGLYSENQVFSLKKASVQAPFSIECICTAISTLKNVGESNRSLDKIATSYTNYAIDLAQAYKLAVEVSSFIEINDTIKNMLKTAKNDLMYIRTLLRQNNCRRVSEFTFSPEEEKTVKADIRALNEAYLEQQKVLLSNGNETNNKKKQKPK